MYKYLFGPVPSRRLGMSLGVDLVPMKVCSLDCVYCECGPTTHLTADRKEYVPVNEVISELDSYMASGPEPDFITFSGSGEPTLNTGIGKVISHIKSNYPGISVAVLTNATLFSDPDVRKELMKADVVLPSLDAVSEDVFKKINRPHSSVKAENYIKGLIGFRKEYRGDIWLEVMVLPGYNDTEEELGLLEKNIEYISPDRVQLNTLDRPGAVEGLIPASYEQLEQIRKKWKGKVEIIAKADRKQVSSYNTDIESVIMDTISRRPCTPEDISQMTGLHISEINKYLDALDREGRVVTEKLERGVFYRSAER